MKTLQYTRQFKKDLKRIQHNPKRINGLKKVLKILQERGTVPKEYKPHFLEGVYKGFMECHVESDLLLIWFDTGEDIIKLICFGTHSELF
jgi:mRNA interferase YafQ